MAVSFSSGRSRGRASGGPPSLRELLPKSARSLASPLSGDDQEVLAYLISFGCNIQPLAGALSPACKSLWKPWKISGSPCSSRARDNTSSNLRMVSPSSSSSVFASQTPSMRSPGEIVWRKASSLSTHKPSFSCDCFACYSSFWSRWTSSPNRDLINEILEIVEKQENDQQANKGKKKKKLDKKQALEKEAGSRKSKGGKGKLQVNLTSSKVADKKPEASPPTQNMDDASGYTDMEDKAALHLMDDALCVRDVKDEAPTVIILMIDGAPILTETKDKASGVTDLKNEESRVTEMKNEASGASGLMGEVLSRFPEMKAKADARIELDLVGNLTVQASLAMAPSASTHHGKSNTKLHLHQRMAKRKSNQVTPLDCEGSLAVAEEEQEANAANENAQTSTATRVADSNLGGRGFLARVFPDALGGVASRLWDLVSFRLRSRTMDYY